MAILSKMIGCGIPAMYIMKDMERDRRVGYGMISRGEIGLVIAGIGMTYGILSNEVYAALIAVIFITSVLPPFLLKRSYILEDQALRTIEDKMIKIER